jgi:putative DNA primase/helicase
MHSATNRELIEFTTPWAHEIAAPGGRPMPLTDLGNSERFVIAHGKNVRHCQATRRWYFWDGTRWAEDTTGDVKRRAKSVMRNILLEAAVQDSEEQRKQVIAHQIRSESDRAIRASIALAESDENVAVRLSDFDCDPMLFNVTNGTLDLRTGELRPHRRNDLLTKLAAVNFDPLVPCPRWDRFLGEIMAGDGDLVAFLRRGIGYSLTGHTNEHSLFLPYGVGANGKTTFLEVVRFVLGDYAAQADFGSFMIAKGQTIWNDLARLRGARFVTAAESESGKRMAETVVKALTGGDTVTVRFLYSEHFEYRPEFKLWLATNHRPKIIGTDEGIWRRIRLVPFAVSIPKERQDRNLSEELKQEASGILNWALAGLRQWQAGGLREPGVVNAANIEYRASQDLLAHFLEAKCTVAPGAEARAGELYRAYRDWSEATGESQINEREFSNALVERGFTKTKIGQRVGKPSGSYWRGVGISSAGADGG